MNKIVLTVITFITIIGIAVLYLRPENISLKTIPKISVNTIDGRVINFGALPEKPLLITFWATTCPECMKEIPHLVNLYNELNGDGFNIIGIAMSYDPPNRVVTLSRLKKIPYTIALDIDGEVARAFGNVELTPTSFLISPTGKIIQHNIGSIDIKNLRLKVKHLLNQNKIDISRVKDKNNALV